jgi:hypothetical protein
MMRGSNGHDFNVYLTRDKLSKVQGEEDEEEEVVRTEFFAIKLVEAGGLMKGEKWHVVIQQVYMCECVCFRCLLWSVYAIVACRHSADKTSRKPVCSESQYAAA